MPAHHLKDHHPVVRLCRRVQTIERLSRDVERRDETKREFGASKIVIDRFRNAHDRNATFIELRSDSERPFATQHHERIDSKDAHVTDSFLVDLFHRDSLTIFSSLSEVTAVTCPQDRSSAGK